MIKSCVVTQSIVSGSVLRNHSILVEGVDANHSSLFKVKVEIKAQAQTEVQELIGLPAPAGLIANADDHGYVDVIIEEKSLAHFFHHQGIEHCDDLNRGLLWVSLWTMVENLRLPSDKFIDFFIGTLEREDNNEILDILFGHVGKAIWDYTPSEMISEKSGLIVSAINRKIQTDPNNKNLRKR